MKNLACHLKTGSEEEARERLQFYRSLVPNALILRSSDGFVCGLCGVSHTSAPEASACLRRCLKAREDGGVITMAPLGETFSCPTCSRRFARREDAVDCHGRERRLSKFYLASVPRRGVLDWDDSGFRGLREREEKGGGRLFRHMLQLGATVPFACTHDFSGAKPRPQKENPPAVTLAPAPLARPSPEEEVPRSQPIDHDQDEAVPEAVAEQPRPQVVPVAEPAPEPEPAPEEDTALPEAAEPEEEGPFREPGMKPFKRHDAKYVCSVCETKFFTKSEVEECFFSHPERRV